jgi:hypothetical protein
MTMKTKEGATGVARTFFTKTQWAVGDDGAMNS